MTFSTLEIVAAIIGFIYLVLEYSLGMAMAVWHHLANTLYL